MTSETDRRPSESAGTCTTRCEFHSGVLHLRPIGSADLEMLYHWRSDKQQSRYLRAPAPRDLDQQRQWYERIKDDPTNVYYMTYHASHPDRPFGYSSITRIDRESSSAEMGVTIGSPEDVGKGQSFYLGGTLLTIAFQRFGLSNVYSSCHPEHTLSMRATDRLGGEVVEGPSPYRKGVECLKVHTPESFAEKVELERARFPLVDEAFDLKCTNPAHGPR